MRRLLPLLLTCLFLAACGGPVKRVWPPQASLQELAVQGDGRWRLKLRLQNFSTVAMRFDEVDLGLRVDGSQAGRIALQPRVTVGPNSAEIVDFALAVDTQVAASLEAALRTGHSLRYRLEGRVVSGEPRRTYDVEFESALHAVPGLAGVLR